MQEIAEARPPYVTFEYRAVEDRSAAISSGQYKAKDVAFAIITPQGSRDRIERVADEWFEHLTEQVSQGRFEPAWLEAYKASFKAWKESREPALNGTDVRNWPALSPAQCKTLLDLNVRTVEDMAAANEETLSRIGMGARALKTRAKEWLASAQDVGKVAETVAALKAQNEALMKRNEKLQADVKDLAEKYEHLAAARAKA